MNIFFSLIYVGMMFLAVFATIKTILLNKIKKEKTRERLLRLEVLVTDAEDGLLSDEYFVFFVRKEMNRYYFDKNIFPEDISSEIEDTIAKLIDHSEKTKEVIEEGKLIILNTRRELNIKDDYWNRG